MPRYGNVARHSPSLDRSAAADCTCHRDLEGGSTRATIGDCILAGHGHNNRGGNDPIPQVPVAGMGRSGNRPDHARLCHRADDPCEPLVADLVHRSTPGCSSDPHREVVRSNDRARRVLSGRLIRSLPPLGTNSRGHRNTPRSGASQRQRSGLEKLLSTIDPVQAACWAETLLDRFGSIQAAFAASESQRRAALGGDGTAATFITGIRSALLELLREEIEDRPLIAGHEALIDYLRVRMAALPVETSQILFLNSRNRLICDDEEWRGTIDQVALYVRDITHRALDVGATSVIVVHNHPSGDPTPSKQDRAITRELACGLRAMGISLLDHLIVAATGIASFRKLGLL